MRQLGCIMSPTEEVPQQRRKGNHARARDIEGLHHGAWARRDRQPVPAVVDDGQPDTQPRQKARQGPGGRQPEDNGQPPKRAADAMEDPGERGPNRGVEGD